MAGPCRVCDVQFRNAAGAIFIPTAGGGPRVACGAKIAFLAESREGCAMPLQKNREVLIACIVTGAGTVENRSPQVLR